MWLKTDLNICESEKIYIMPFPFNYSIEYI